MKLLITLMVLLPLSGMAQTPSAASACSTEQHRQFDFWIGRWQVSQNGQDAGINTIELTHNGCVLTEDWTSAQGGFSGSSINLYDAARQQWHQTWSDSGGNLLLLEGGLEAGSMVMSGSRPGPEGKTLTDRISWTPNEDGSIRQHWQTKSETSDWQTVFDGHYVRIQPQ